MDSNLIGLLAIALALFLGLFFGLSQFRKGITSKVIYDKENDTLYCHTIPNVPATSIDWNGIWLRINPVNGELVGIEIEGYREHFCQKNLARFGGGTE